MLEKIERSLDLPRIAQQTGFGNLERNALIIRARLGFGQQAATFFELAIGSQQAGGANPGHQILLADINHQVVGDGFVSPPAVLGDLAEVVVSDALVGNIERQETFELRLGVGTIILLQRQHRRRKDHFRPIRIIDEQLVEIGLGVGITFFTNQGARKLQLDVARFRITFDEVLEEANGIGVRLPGTHLRLKQSRLFPVGA